MHTSKHLCFSQTDWYLNARNSRVMCEVHFILFCRFSLTNLTRGHSLRGAVILKHSANDACPDHCSSRSRQLATCARFSSISSIDSLRKYQYKGKPTEFNLFVFIIIIITLHTDRETNTSKHYFIVCQEHLMNYKTNSCQYRLWV